MCVQVCVISINKYYYYVFTIKPGQQFLQNTLFKNI